MFLWMWDYSLSRENRRVIIRSNEMVKKAHVSVAPESVSTKLRELRDAAAGKNGLSSQSFLRKCEAVHTHSGPRGY